MCEGEAMIRNGWTLRLACLETEIRLLRYANAIKDAENDRLLTALIEAEGVNKVLAERNAALINERGVV